MIYEYNCNSCHKSFDLSLPVDKRDMPVENNYCPLCDKGNIDITRSVSAATINYSGFKSVINRTSDHWKDTLKEIHKSAGKHSKVKDSL